MTKVRAECLLRLTFFMLSHILCYLIPRSCRLRLLQFGIYDTRMINSGKALLESILHYLDIAETDGRLIEEALLLLGVDDAIHQIADSLRSIFREASRGSLNRVSHHQYGSLASLRIGSGIGEGVSIHISIRALIDRSIIEITGH